MEDRRAGGGVEGVDAVSGVGVGVDFVKSTVCGRGVDVKVVCAPRGKPMRFCAWLIMSDLIKLGGCVGRLFEGWRELRELTGSK